MKKINLGFSNDADCLKVAQGAIQSARAAGIDRILLHNVFSKNYSLAAFTQQLYKIIFNEKGITKVCICLDSAPYSELTEEKKLLIPTEAKNAGNYVNRFAPVDHVMYSNIIFNLLSSIEAMNLTPYQVQTMKQRYRLTTVDPKIINYISFELWQEPDSKKYFWGTFEEFKSWTTFKYDLLKATGRPMYIGDFTASLLTDADFKDKRKWLDWINTDPIFNQPNVFFSHSFYWHNNAGWFNRLNNDYPSRFIGGGVVQYNMYAGGDADKATIMNSPQWGVWFIELLQTIVEYNWPIETIYFFCLLDCNDRDNKGSHAAYQKSSGDLYVMKPLFHMIRNFAEMLSDGKGGFAYEVIEDGVKGLKKKALITSTTTYSITDL